MLSPSRIAGLATCLLFAVHGSAKAQGDSTASRRSGFYTEEQGTRGLDVYKGKCSRCHSIADHSGPDFRLAWHGQSVRSLFEYVRGTMPDDDPGGLSVQQYLDVTAYLLKLNGMPPGDSALQADSTALKKLVIDIKAPGSGSANPMQKPLPPRHPLLR